MEYALQQSTRKLAEELEDSRLAEARRAEDLRRKAARERQDLEHKLAMARAGTLGGPGPLSSTILVGSHPGDLESPANPNKRSYSSISKGSQEKRQTVIHQTVDAWIYEPFIPSNASREDQAIVTMSMLPNLKPFAGDPREWPMFIQAFKNMVHDVFCSDAQRLSMLHSMLGDKLRAGMSQILNSPTAYRQALQELRRKYGHPHLVVRTYIQGLMEMTPFQGGDALEEFSTKLHGAVATLESAGYGHELESSVALEGLVRKLPESMISRWGRQVNRLLPGIPTLRDLDAWLEDEVMGEKNVRRFATIIKDSPNTTRPGQHRDQPRNHTPTINAIEQVKGYGGKCTLCKAEPGHGLIGCPKFTQMTPTERAQTIWELRNCFRCLGRNHHSNECKKETTCTITGCARKHHTLLHGSDAVAPKRTTNRGWGQ